MSLIFSMYPPRAAGVPSRPSRSHGVAQHDTPLAIKLIDVDATHRRFAGIASAEVEDRMGDVVRCDGIDLSEYKTNPVILADHTRGFVIGKATQLWRERREGANCLMVEVQGVPRGTSARTDEVWATIDDGSRRGLSIGFQVTSSEPRTTAAGGAGMLFKTSRLLEISSVDLPACASCLLTAKTVCKHGCGCAGVSNPDEVVLELADEPVTNRAHLASGVWVGGTREGGRALARRLQGGR
jgi:prohead serine protease